MSECYQISHGPTPCFRDSGLELSNKNGLPCGRETCPISELLEVNPNLNIWQKLHSDCVVTDPFDYRGKHKSIQLSLIASKKD